MFPEINVEWKLRLKDSSTAFNVNQCLENLALF